ncbi:phosphoribosylaminoimidazolesuccinocarboxamide synthase [Jeotgalicoccus sp. ATCC 8456]|uniref:phosphoribosylaminoimidazolesuccinocarboxamide synthase n=1 Tax=Jeotgalicoccus sp. ATCC 8456 TaxID=946435 RepID=UPI0018E61B05|nr:phosphoribosylaminoimidazolesuccinocarboxamide synthase [Jeotgalicoccus sp. ATCC 8456]QQD84990.1 phosphoribosylaminoimidazolesuccinocarboxamide synthase [Jeotgalicoccus sp. ATCC 8456]
MSLLYEGKAKSVYTTAESEVLLIEYKDEVTAGNGEKHDFVPGKGRLNNLISASIFKHLKAHDIKSHFIEETGETSQLVKKVTIIPLEVVVRNIVAGNIVKRLGFKEGHVFDTPLVEFYLKEDDLKDPLVTEDHIHHLKIATSDELSELKNQALKINSALTHLMDEMNLKLVDFKIEFGRDDQGNILLADEISPDTCRLWDKTTNKNLDKDVYRNNTGSLIETYNIFYNKLEEIKNEKN